MVLSDLTTFVSGNSRWICSPMESVLHTESVGGMPREKSSGLETSMRILPRRLFAPAMRSASSAPPPEVQLKRSSPKAALSAKLPSEALAPAFLAHSAAFSLPALREPILTLWPDSTSFEAMVLPTIPVPSTPMFMGASIPPGKQALGQDKYF